MILFIFASNSDYFGLEFWVFLLEKQAIEFKFKFKFKKNSGSDSS